MVIFDVFNLGLGAFLKLVDILLSLTTIIPPVFGILVLVCVALGIIKAILW